MARTDGIWKSVGSYIRTTFDNGKDILVAGINKYINFGSVSGSSGYGIRDNSGQIQIKHSGGSWSDVGDGIGDMLKATYDPANKAEQVLTVGDVSDTAYDATSWNGNTDIPTKNVLRDKFESLAGGHDPVTVTDSSEIDFTLTGQDITASLKAGSIDETKLDTSVNASLDLADSASQPGHAHTDLVPYTGATGNVNIDGYSLIAAKIIGGSTTTSDLYIQTTTGVGTTGADMHFLVGNNGATEAMTILNGGNVGIGTTAPASVLDVSGSQAGKHGIVARYTRSIGNSDYPLSVQNDTGLTTFAIGANQTASEGHIVLSAPTGQGSVGIDFFSDVGGTTKSGTFQMDSAGNYVFRQQTSGSMFFDYISGVYFRDSAYATRAFIANGTGNSYFNGGNVGIGTTSPTAVVHIKAGTATASTAPLKFTAGTVNTTPEAGAIEFNGTDLFISI